MAEIILPPEEEAPQTPELNIDKPTENSKVISIEFEAKKTNKVSTKDTNQQLYTTDTDAWFEFKETSLGGANGTYSVVFRNRHDGSIFQRTGDVVNGVAYYKIPHQEIRHAGAWRGQIVYTLSNGDTTSREFGYDVKGHILDGKDVREVVVEDFETLMSQLRSMKDNVELELANLTQELKNTAEQNETDRQVFFDDLVEDIDELQVNYQELLDTGVLQTNINTKLEALEEEYAPKLTEVTAQLAQTAKKTEVQQALNLKRDKSSRISMNDFDGETLGIIQDGTGGTPVNVLSDPRDKSVTPVKTTFIHTSTNLIDESKAILNKRLNGSGELIDASGARVTDYFPVKGGSQYTVVGSAEMCFYSEKSTSSFIEINRYSSTSQPSTSQAPSNANYARYTLSSGYSTPQVNEGDTLLPYEEYYSPTLSNDIRVERPPVTPKETDFIKQSSNLFNKDNVATNQRLNLITGEPVESINSTTGLDFIEVEPSTQYYFQGLRRIAMYDNDKNKVAGRELLSTEEFVTTHSMAKYVRFSGDTSDLSFMQFSKEKVPYEPYGDFLSNNIKINKKNLLKSNEFFNEFSKVYKSELLLGGYPDDSSDIISLFDDLVDGEYVKREFLGKDDFDNDIVAYSATKPNPPNEFNFERLKIGITTGVHGNERNPVTGFYAFMRDLIENKENNEMFNAIKSLVDFHYVPLVTPSAWDLNRRNNGNNININRNFTTNWTPAEEDFGTGPASEKETQLLEQWLEDNPVDYFIDVHTTVAVDNPWFAAMYEKDEGLKLIKNYYDTKMILSNWWGDRPDIDFPKNTVIGQALQYRTDLPQLWVHADALGYKSSLIELAGRYSPDFSSTGGVTQTFSAETIGNFIIQLLKDEGVI